MSFTSWIYQIFNFWNAVCEFVQTNRGIVGLIVVFAGLVYNTIKIKHGFVWKTGTNFFVLCSFVHETISTYQSHFVNFMYYIVWGMIFICLQYFMDRWMRLLRLKPIGEHFCYFLAHHVPKQPFSLLKNWSCRNELRNNFINILLIH